MIKKLFIFLLFLNSFNLFSYDLDEEDGVSKHAPVPYDKNEFPEWARDIRRFEVVTLGATPIVMLLTSLLYDQIAPVVNKNNPCFTGVNTQEHLINKIAISLSISGTLAIVDFIIHRVTVSEQRRKRNAVLQNLR